MIKKSWIRTEGLKKNIELLWQLQKSEIIVGLNLIIKKYSWFLIFHQISFSFPLVFLSCIQLILIFGNQEESFESGSLRVIDS